MAAPTLRLPNFAAKIRSARLDQGMSQLDMADATGYSQSAVAAWESGETVPTAPALVAIAKALDLPLDELIGVIMSDAVAASASDVASRTGGT